MKSLFYSVFVTLLFSLSAFAQNEGISFQGLARNAAGEVLVSQKISLRLSILLDSETGTVAYAETRQVTTNPQGIFSLVVGDDKALTKSTNFSSINWTPAPKFIKVEMDPNGGASYVAMGTSRLQAVPFAFYAYGVDATNVKGLLPVASGGTGVASIADLKTSLGLDTFNSAALDTKVDKVAGKGLSSNDYTTAEKTKLAGITGTNTGDQDLSSYATISQLATKANAADVIISLATKANASDVTTSLATKVDKETGKELSTNDYTTAEKTKLAAITGTNTGDQDLSGYATTTQLATKANASDVTTSLATKVDKVTGKELSTNDYTTAEKTKLAAITGTNTGDQDLSSYATTTQLATKANASDVTTSLATKVDKVTGKGLSTNDYSTAERDKLAAITGTNTGDQVNITGNAGTATKLQTARTINGIAFDGSANITLPAAASGIPYTGATEAVNLGAFDLTVNGLTIGSGKNKYDVNVAIGKNALSNTITGFQANYITAVGFEALKNDTWGYFNTGIGSSALFTNTTGLANTAVGSNALYSNTTANYNTAVGTSALRLNTTGESNTATGNSALENTTTGIFNTAIGAGGLKSNVTGSNNSAVGTGALSFSNTNNNTAMGTNSLKNTTGYSNTALGNAAGDINTTGNENTAIGATATFGANNLSNATAIGFGATASASNSVRLGNASVTVIGGQVAWTAASDSRIKKNIVNSTYGLATVLKLRPVEYNLTSNDLKQVGFIAQEVQKLVPEVVTGKEGDLSKGEILGITYSNLVPVLTKAIQEQQKQIEDQNAKIAAQQKQIEELIKLVKGQ
uniref:tail fiber domain-containing protein n=1 Tax=Algoriphagus sp. TaxID=1872435 RepID=UPI00404866BE